MTGKPSLRARKKQATWEAIASAGAALFSEHGFGATTLEEIAEAANVHKQTVLRYFKNKEEIALAYQIRAQEIFQAGLLNPQRSVGVIEFWREHVKQSARSLTARGGLNRSQRVIDSDPGVLAHAAAIEHRYQDLIADALTREAGIRADIDLYAIALAGLLVAGNFGIARKARALKKPVDLEKTVLSVVDFALKTFPLRASPRAK